MLFALRVLLVLLRVLKKNTLERYTLWKVGFRKYFLKEQMISSCAPWFQRSSPRGVILQMVSPYAPGSRRRSPRGRSCSPASSPPSTPPPPPHPSPSGSPSRSTSETQESHLDVCLPYFWYQTILSCLFVNEIKAWDRFSSISCHTSCVGHTDGQWPSHNLCMFTIFHNYTYFWNVIVLQY